MRGELSCSGSRLQAHKKENRARILNTGYDFDLNTGTYRSYGMEQACNSVDLDPSMEDNACRQNGRHDQKHLITLTNVDLVAISQSKTEMQFAANFEPQDIMTAGLQQLFSSLVFWMVLKLQLSSCSNEMAPWMTLIKERSQGKARSESFPHPGSTLETWDSYQCPPVASPVTRRRLWSKMWV